MAASVFGSRLDLLVRLYDTTTGAPVDERNVLFTRNEEPVIPAPRGEGMYVFINTGREDFLIGVVFIIGSRTGVILLQIGTMLEIVGVVIIVVDTIILNGPIQDGNLQIITFFFQ